MTTSAPPPATAQGTLESAPLAQLFAYVLDKKLSGSLVLDGPDGTYGTVIFRDGWPMKARTREPHYLGMVLHTLGLVDPGNLNASLARLASEKRLHGQILREMGALTDEGLQRGLRAQLTEKLEPLFGLPAPTRYRFHEAYDALAGWGGDDAALLDPLAVIWAALERWPPLAHIDKALARVPQEVRMRVTAKLELSRFRFAKRTQDLLELMRQRPLTLVEMIGTGEVEAPQARLAIYCLLMTKQITFAIGEQAAPPMRPPLQSFSLTPGSLPPSQQPPAPSQAPRRPTTQPPVRRHASAPPPGVDYTPELAERRNQIIERAATIMEEDYFSVLGIARASGPDAAQQAFVTLAKSWHPDRLAPQLFDVHDLAAKVFARMSEARAVLTDPNTRAEYVLTLRQAMRSSPSMAPGVNAPLEFQKADIQFKKKAYAEAIEHCRRAHEADPANADYLALLTWLKVEKDGTNQANAPRHLEALDRAVKLNDRCERAHFYRGMLLKRMGKPDKAYLDFKDVAEINPNNIDAAREVLLYRKRGG
jgi:tetratricopeptide (TPR) repeat protein